MLFWRMILASAAIIGALFSISAEAEDAPCTLKRVASIPVTVTNGKILIPATLNGKQIKYIFHRGSWLGFTIFNEAAKRLGVSVRPNIDWAVRRIGGEDNAGLAYADKLAIGELKLQHVPLISVDWPPTDDADAPAGLLGASFLHHFDLEIDLAENVVNLFSQDQFRYGEDVRSASI